MNLYFHYHVVAPRTPDNTPGKHTVLRPPALFPPYRTTGEQVDSKYFEGSYVECAHEIGKEY